MVNSMTGVALLFLFCVPNAVVANDPDTPGPRTHAVDFEAYKVTRYVSQMTGSDMTGDGSKLRPWKTIAHALMRIDDARIGRRYALLIAEGTYAGTIIHMKCHVDLYGGFSAEGWQRDVLVHQTVLDGEGQRRLLIGADLCKLDGFVIRNGLVRGKGAGLLCESVSPVITNNVFVSNQTLAPESWSPTYRHEIANDGAAIYCEKGAAPVIANNIFVHNQTEVGRGGGVALHDHCDATIQRNVFLYNRVGVKDPQRSSDGGALSIFAGSKPLVEKNVFLGNQALASNDAGGVFVALWSSAIIRGNIFVDNRCDDDGGALFVGGQEHRYDRPLDPLPPADSFFVDIIDNVFIGNRNPSMNSGAMRFTMESRGRFANNIVAHNDGIYFQRSEVAVLNNTILDHLLFVETKAGLQPGIIANNILWGRFEKDTATPVTHCNLRGLVPGDGNIRADPGFRPDGLRLTTVASAYCHKTFVTTLVAPGLVAGRGDLAGRVVRAGDAWSVIKSNDGATLEVWGRLSGAVSVVVLPTYRLDENSPCRDAGTSAHSTKHDLWGEPRPKGAGVDIGADEY